MYKPNKNILSFAVGTLLILTIPLLARWPWTLTDYVTMGILIFGTGIMYELITKKVGKKNRFIVAAVLIVVFLLVWAELAVGIFGTPFAGN